MSQVTLCRALTYSQVVKSRRYGHSQASVSRHAWILRAANMLGRCVLTRLIPGFPVDEFACIRNAEVNTLLKR